MYKLNNAELEMLLEALDMMQKSNTRMENAKPKFTAIFKQIETDIVALRIKLQSPPQTK